MRITKKQRKKQKTQRARSWIKAAAMVGVGAVVLSGGALNQLPVAQAGILDQLRDSIRSLWTQKAAKQQEARRAWAKAEVLQKQSMAAHERLERTQQALQVANEHYYNYWRQMRRTEAQIVDTRHRVQIVSARYKRRRILFGRRMAAMQRSGELSYLQLFLGSRSLSDLTRRAFLFDTVTSRDAELQAELRADKIEVEREHNTLMEQWHYRDRLQQAANTERERIAKAESERRQIEIEINNSRDAALAYADVQEQSSREIEKMIGELSARRAAIIQAYEEQAAREREAAYHGDDSSEVGYSRHSGGNDWAIPASGWSSPVSGHLSSTYGMRLHPILGQVRMHTGDDVAASYGSPIKAARNGRVLWAGWKKAYGNTIIIDHGDGVSTLYGHASRLGVKPGQPIKAGEYIGNVGSTGWSTGAHLHFEVRKNGSPINPSPYLRSR
jgi:murein DD-endopeptidase MepM/ murein hydrolase activator NlpD